MLTPDQANALVLQQQQQALALQQSQTSVPVAGPSMYPPQFNYAPPAGVGVSHMLPGLPGMLGNAVPGALGGIGMAAGVGSTFLPGSTSLAALSLLDPFAAALSGGMAGYGAAGVGGAALGAGAAGGVALAGVGTAAFAGHRFAAGATQQANLGSQLSGLGFANTMSESGRGFDFHGLHTIGEMMREFEAADPFTTMQDLSQLMDRFNQQGLAQGITDAKDFAKKFTEYADAVRDIATTMGTTLTDAAPMFGQMRQIGFYSAQDVMGNTVSMQAAQGLGMGSDQFLGMQAGGSQITRQAQMSGLAGARSSSALAQSLMIGAMGRSSGGLGNFTDEYLMDITGAEDLSSATSQLSQQYTGSFTRFLRGTPGGRALLAQVGQMEGGQFTGEIDRDALSGIAGGGTSLSDLGRSGASRLQGRKSAISFKGNEHNIASKVLESEEGIGAIYSLLEAESKKLLGDDSDDNVVIMAQKLLQMDYLQAELLVKTMKDRSQAKSLIADSLRQERAAAAYRLEMSRDRSVGGLYQQARGGAEDFFAPATQLGANTQTAWEQFGQDASDAVWGIQRYGGVTGASRQSFGRQMARGDLDAMAIRDAQRGEYSRGGTGHAIDKMGGNSALLFADAMKGTLKADQLDPLHSGSLRRELTPDKREAALDIVTRIRIAEEVGDEDAAEEAREEFADLADTLRGTLGRRDQMGRVERKILDDAGKHGNRDSTAAWLAAELGDQGLARNFVVRGGGAEDGTFRAMKDVKADLDTALDRSNLDTGLASGLRTGEEGSGAKALAFMKRHSLGRTSIQTAMRKHGKGAAESFRLEYGDKGGLDAVSDAEIVSALKISEGVSGGLGQAHHAMAGTTLLASGLGAAGIDVMGYGSADAAFQGVMAASTEVSDTAHMLGQRGAVSAEIAMMGSPLRRALGESSLSTLMSTENGAEYRGALGSVYDRIAGGSLRGVRGGAALQGVVDRTREADTPEKLMELYGVSSIAELEKYSGTSAENYDKKVSAAELKQIQRTLGMSAINEKLSASGGSGGVAFSGMTFEEQLLHNQGITAEKVQKMAEAVDSAFTSLDMQGLIQDYPGTSDGS